MRGLATVLVDQSDFGAGTSSRSSRLVHGGLRYLEQGDYRLVFEALHRGELVEPFGAAGRITSPFSYWMLVAPGSRARPEVTQFTAWVEAEAKATREAVGAKPPAC